MGFFRIEQLWDQAVQLTCHEGLFFLYIRAIGATPCLITMVTSTVMYKTLRQQYPGGYCALLQQILAMVWISCLPVNKDVVANWIQQWMLALDGEEL